MRKILNQFVLWGAIFAIASLCHAQDNTYQTKVYKDNNGDRLCVNSGGSITVYSGGDLDLKSGAKLLLNSVDMFKVPAFMDNAGTKIDSGTLTVIAGSQTVTTSLTTCELVFVTISAAGSHSVNYEALGSSTTFTLQGWLSGTEGTKYVGTASGYWMAIDQ